MQMKVTESFLWSLYNLGQKLGYLTEPFEFMLWPTGRLTRILHPDLYQVRKAWDRKKGRENFTKLISYLKKKGYIKIETLQNKQAVLLTHEGAQRLLKIKLKTSKLKRRKDKKWQMVFFDIPEKLRVKRDYFRAALRNLGYKQLQKSIWISPYEVLHETQVLVKHYALEPYMRFLLVEEIKL